MLHKLKPCKGKHIRIMADFSMETLKARRTWSNALHVIQDVDCQTTLLHPEKLSAIVEEIKTFHSLKEIISNESEILNRTLEAILHTEERNEHSQKTLQQKQQTEL